MVKVGKTMSDQERRDKLERLAHVRQQKNNFFISESAKKLKNRIGKREKEIAELEAKEVTLNEEMATLDPSDRMATVAKAQEFEQVQLSLQKALDDWESATSELEALNGPS